MIELKRLYTIVLLVSLFGTSSTFCQSEYRHSLTLKSSMYNFLDGSPMFQPKSGLWQQIVVNGYGLDYQRFVNQKHSWSVSVNTFYFVNTQSFATKERGDILFRNFIYLDGKYQYNFFTSNHHRLFWESGIGFRLGDEVYFLDLYQHETWGEVSSRAKVLADIGISTGVNYKYNLKNSRFNLNSSLGAIVFPYTYDKKDPKYLFDIAPNWKMLYFSIGLGVNFGKVSEG